MKRPLLIGLVLVVVLAVALFVLVSRPEPSSEDRGRTKEVSGVPAARTPVDRPVERTMPERRAESSDRSPDRSRPGGAGDAREYFNSQGALVRDHRSAEDAPEFNPVVTERPGPRKLEPRVVEGVRDTIYSSVRDCTQNLDPSEFGERPRAQAEVIVSVLGGRVTTDQALMKYSNVPEAQGTRMSECIQSQIEQMAFAADGHEDISQYRVTVAFPLKK